MINEHVNKTIHTFYEFCYWVMSNKCITNKEVNVDLFLKLEKLSVNEIHNFNNYNYNFNHVYLRGLKTLWDYVRNKNIKPVICFYPMHGETAFVLCYRCNNNIYFPRYYLDQELCDLDIKFKDSTNYIINPLNKDSIQEYIQGIYKYIYNEKTKKWVKEML